MVLVRLGFREYVADEVFLVVVFKVLVNFCTSSLPSLILQHTVLQKDIVYHWKRWLWHIYLFMHAR